VEEVLQIIRNTLNRDPSFPERSPLQVEDVMELLDICITTMYFQFEDKFYQQKEGMTMGNSLFWSVIYSIYGMLCGNNTGYSRPQSR
jgi:hypothetical protein